MPAGFTESERAIITTKLKQAALECMQRYGVRKTNVEQLTDKAGISKGAFYSFYESKEELMFEVMDETGWPIQQKLGEQLQAAQSAQQVSTALFELCTAMKSSFIIDLIKNGEIDYLMRKLPEKAVAQSYALDIKFIEKYLSGFLRSDIDPAAVITVMSMLYTTMMHTDWYPPGEYEKALRLLIDAFVNHIIKP